MKRILFACLFLVACATESGNAPPPPTSGEDTGHVDDMGDDDDDEAGDDSTPDYPWCPCILYCMAEIEMATISADEVQSSPVGRCIDECGGTQSYAEANSCCQDASVEDACAGSPGTDCEEHYEAVCIDASNGDDAMDDAAETSPDPDTGGDESGGDVCDMYGEYRCRGTAIGLYYNTAAGPLDINNTANWNYMPLGGTYPADSTVACIEESVCIPYWGEAVNPPMGTPVYEDCKLECEKQIHDWPLDHPGNAGWEFTGYTACVFGTGGPWGVPDNTYCTDLDQDSVYEEAGECVTLTHNPGASYGDNCDSTGSTTQVEYVDECENRMCEDATCGDWPGRVLTSSFNSSTKTYTVSVEEDFLLELLFGGAFNTLYRCDAGFWTMYGSGATETWKMNGLVAGDLLYMMGWRSNDKDLKIRANLSGAALKPMYGTFSVDGKSGWMNMLDAYLALYAFSSWRFEWKRQVGGTWVTHHMILTAI